jgi:hypothetical protein
MNSPHLSKADSFVSKMQSEELLFVPGGALLHWESSKTKGAVMLQYCYIDASNFRMVRIFLSCIEIVILMYIL